MSLPLPPIGHIGYLVDDIEQGTQRVAQKLLDLQSRHGISSVVIPMPQMEALAEVIQELNGVTP
jgi:hypothetical protein